MKVEVEILKTVLRGSIDRKENKLTPADVSMIKNVIHLIENTKHIHTKEDVVNAYLDGFKASGEGFNGEYPYEGYLDVDIKRDIKVDDYYNEKFNK